MKYLPEAVIGLLAGYFFLRELGSFPAAWADDGLFMLVAKNVAEGRGYGLEILGRAWEYPYFLGVGPTLILPSAVLIHLFGFYIAVARIAMVGYLFLSSMTILVFSKILLGRSSALLSLLLLITFSGFVNTGKPMMGEVPGFFFLMLGLLLWMKQKPAWTVGLCFGLAIVTKMSYGLILPALVATLTYQLLRRLNPKATPPSREGPGEGVVVLMTTMLITLTWKLWETLHAGGALSELLHIAVKQGGEMPFSTLLNNPESYLRLPYIALAFFVIFGGIGLKKSKLPADQKVFIGSLIVLFILYFLNAEPWYRKVLPAHLLLLPFVPLGVFTMFKKNLGLAILILIISIQAYWQFDHRGSSRSTDAAVAAEILEQEFWDTPLVIQQFELFVRLPENPNWHLYLPTKLTARLPQEHVGMTEEFRCIPLVKKSSDGTAIGSTGYHVLDPPPTCSPASSSPTTPATQSKDA